MSPDGDISMEEAIEAGRAKYVDQRYRQALDFFTEAIKLCPCEIEKRKRKRDDYEAQELDGGTEANQPALSSPSLECGNPLHLQALNYRAGTFEKIPDLRRAKADGWRMMVIAPCSPEGYLRTNKLLRMEQDPATAYQVLTDGILEIFERGVSQVEDVQRLDQARNPLKSKFGKFDPLGGFLSLSWMSKAHLPGELVRDIFGRLELSTLCKCLCVSKSWRKILTAPGSAQLWKSLVFTGSSAPSSTIPLDILKKLLAHSFNDVRELVIDNSSRFGLDQRKFNAILNAGAKLERLELAKPYEALALTRPPRNLKHLRLEGFYRFYRPENTGRDPYVHFLLTAVATLESLTLAGLPRPWFTEMGMPLMPNLRLLKLTRVHDQPWHLSILPTLRNAPQLEQLYIKDLILDCRHPSGEPFDNCCVPNLKSLTIVDTRPRVHRREDLLNGTGVAAVSVEAYKHLVALNFGKSLKALDIRYSWEYTIRDNETNDIFSRIHQEHEYEYQDLQILRLSNTVLSPDIARILFMPSIKVGKLTSFDIIFPLPALNERQGESSVNHIQGYQWLEGAESIRHIGIYEFGFKPYMYPTDNPLIRFLQTFPSLEELELESHLSLDYEFVQLVEDVLTSVKLKSIYTTKISGSAFDKVRRLAKEKGVEFVWTKQIPKWPINFRDD